MTFPGVSQSLSHFMVVQITMIIIIMLEDKAKATLLQCLHIVIIFMELTRSFPILILLCTCLGYNFNICNVSGLTLFSFFD